MVMTRSLLAALLVVCVGSISTAWAADPAEAVESPADASAVETPEDDGELVRQLIKDLNDDKFAVRQSASRQLSEQGKSVIPSLVKAAQSEHLEVTTRCLDLLEGFLKADDIDLQNASREALTELAATEHEAAAGRAAKILEKHKAPPTSNLGRVLPNGRIQIVPGRQRIQIGGQQIQIQIGGAIGGKNVFKKVQIKTVNGVRTVEASDNNRTVKIVDDPNKGIHMEVTQKKGDEEETKTYDAKDEAELKKKHPEAHKIYKEFAGNGGQVQINGLQIIQGGRGPIQIGPGKQKQEEAEEAEDVEAAVEEAKKAAEDVKKAVEEALEEAERAVEEAIEKDGEP